MPIAPRRRRGCNRRLARPTVSILALALALPATGLASLAAAATQPATAHAARTAAARATPTGPLAARILRRTQMRSSPGGRIVTTLDAFTEYGDARIMAVVARRGTWLGVVSESMPNSRAGWIPAADAALRHERYAIDVDRSARLLTVRRLGHVIRRVRIAVGRPGFTTPLGRFGVTDRVRYIGASPYGYGSLPISGRQPTVAPDRNRLGIHGTTDAGSIGSAASHGCLRASDGDMRWLVRWIPQGTLVRIHA